MADEYDDIDEMMLDVAEIVNELFDGNATNFQLQQMGENTYAIVFDTADVPSQSSECECDVCKFNRSVLETMETKNYINFLAGNRSLN
jgi:hypothetical protein